MANGDEFRDIAIARDLARKPEIKMLAICLWRIWTDDPIDRDNIPPMFVRMAHRMITDPKHIENLNHVLEVVL